MREQKDRELGNKNEFGSDRRATKCLPEGFLFPTCITPQLLIYFPLPPTLERRFFLVSDTIGTTYPQMQTTCLAITHCHARRLFRSEDDEKAQT